MQAEQLPGAAGYTRRNMMRRIWRKIVQFLACVVVFCTTYALILPAITQENEALCGLEEHTHQQSCYLELVLPSVTQLSRSAEIHSHDDTCLDSEGGLQCGLADYAAHSHDETCLDAEGTLVCPLPERAAHVHDDTCYETVTTEREAAVSEETAHSHSAECYTARQGELICALSETGHTHTEEACSGKKLVCGIPENHIHETDCY